MYGCVYTYIYIYTHTFFYVYVYVYAYVYIDAFWVHGPFVFRFPLWVSSCGRLHPFFYGPLDSGRVCLWAAILNVVCNWYVVGSKLGAHSRGP